MSIFFRHFIGDVILKSGDSGGSLDSLVGANTGGFKGLRAQLLVLVGNEMDAERELIDIGSLATKIEDTNLRVGHTSVEARLMAG